MEPPFARKDLGQHFLRDRGAVQRIVDLVDPRPDDTLLEIGPGRGALTAPLLERAAPIAAVERDPRLAAELRAAHGTERLALLEQDVLELEFATVAATLGRPPGTRLVVVGNLPYNISKPVALKLVTERAAVERAVLMFQREVAARIVASPSSRDYGPLSVLVSETYTVRREFDLQPGAFRPPPKVVSSVTTWRRREEAGLDADEERRLRACLSACFAQRRKTLRNNLRGRLGQERSERLLERTGIDGAARAESLTPQQFRSLAAAWPDRLAADEEVDASLL